jgi:dihydrofolate reductase
MILSSIAALSKNRVIGANNGIPWHIPEDAKWFRQKTKGHPVLMGRKTYETMGEPLKGRTNIVITHSPTFAPPNVLVAATIEEGIALAKGTPGDEELFVMGGETIYRQTMDIVDRLYLTHIDMEVEGDTFFPEFDESDWTVIFRETHPATEIFPHTFEFVIYERAER